MRNKRRRLRGVPGPVPSIFCGKPIIKKPICRMPQHSTEESTADVYRRNRNGPLRNHTRSNRIVSMARAARLKSPIQKLRCAKTVYQIVLVKKYSASLGCLSRPRVSNGRRFMIFPKMEFRAWRIIPKWNFAEGACQKLACRNGQSL